MVVDGLRRAWRARRVVLALWALGLITALPIALLTGQVVHRVFGPRLASEAVAARLEPLYAAELLFSHKDTLATLVPVGIGALLLWAALSPLRHGLALGAAAEGSGRAFEVAGRAFGPLLRLAPMTWLASAALLAGPAALATKLASAGVESWVSDKAVFGLRLALLGLLALWMGWLRGAVEQMRAQVVVHGRTSAWQAFLRGGLGAALRPLQAAGPVWALSGAALLVTALASLLDARLVRDGWGLFALGLVLQQSVAMLRALLEVALSGAVVARLQAKRAP